MDLSGLLLNPILKPFMQNPLCFSLLGLPGAEPSARDAGVGTQAYMGTQQSLSCSSSGIPQGRNDPAKCLSTFPGIIPSGQ